MSERFKVKDSSGKRPENFEADTPAEAAILWALERLNDDEEDLCHVFRGEKLVGAFALARVWEATEVMP